MYTIFVLAFLEYVKNIMHLLATNPGLSLATGIYLSIFIDNEHYSRRFVSLALHFAHISMAQRFNIKLLELNLHELVWHTIFEVENQVINFVFLTC